MSEPTWELLGGGGAVGGPIDYVGAWAAGTQYQPGQVVRYNGTDYLAVNPSLGQTPPAVALIPKGSAVSWVGPWAQAAPGATTGAQFTVATAGYYWVLVTASSWSTGVSAATINVWFDGVQNIALNHFFNAANQHMTLPPKATLVFFSAGTHYAYLQATGSINSDSSDTATVFLVPA